MIGKDEYLDLNHHSILYIYRCCVISLIVKLCCQKESKTHRPPVLKFVGYDKTYKADSESVISCDKKWVLFYIYIYKKDEYKTRDKPMLSWVSYDTK